MHDLNFLDLSSLDLASVSATSNGFLMGDDLSPARSVCSESSTTTPRPKSLTPNTIYAALNATETIGYFHWMICLAIDNQRAYKFHATNDNGQSAWRYEVLIWESPLHDPLAITLTRIGVLDEGLDHEALNLYLHNIPIGYVPDEDRPREPQFNCRSWFRQAVRGFHDAGLFVKCPCIDALEDWLQTTATAAEYQDGFVDLPLLLETKFANAWDF